MVNLRVSAQMLQRIREFAKEDRMSVGEWVRRSLEGSIQYAHYAKPENRRLVGQPRRRPFPPTITVNSAWDAKVIWSEPKN